MHTTYFIDSSFGANVAGPSVASASAADTRFPGADRAPQAPMLGFLVGIGIAGLLWAFIVSAAAALLHQRSRGKPL